MRAIFRAFVVSIPLALFALPSGCTSGANGEGSGGGGGGASPDAGGRDTPTASECGDLPAVVRDFRSALVADGHPDFEDEDSPGGVIAGLVLDTLGDDGKPVLSPNAADEGDIESAATFAEWYEDVEGVNRSFEVGLPLTESSDGSGVYVFEDSSFFPIDGRGFGNSGHDDGTPHNFHFTTEIHTQFVYERGQRFTFRGDDDIWIFIDGELVIDLGGVHGEETATVALDELGLIEGEAYPMDVFHAERHTGKSNFRIETSISCFTPVWIPQ